MILCRFLESSHKNSLRDHLALWASQWKSLESPLLMELKDNQVFQTLGIAGSVDDVKNLCRRVHLRCRFTAMVPHNSIGTAFLTMRCKRKRVHHGYLHPLTVFQFKKSFRVECYFFVSGLLNFWKRKTMENYWDQAGSKLGTHKRKSYLELIAACCLIFRFVFWALIFCFRIYSVFFWLKYSKGPKTL